MNRSVLTWKQLEIRASHIILLAEVAEDIFYGYEAISSLLHNQYTRRH
jgi:hypothetical protein